MFSIKGDATVATVTDLRRSAKELLDRAEAGESIVVQRNAQAIGVLLDYRRYRRMLDLEEQLEDIRLLILALTREADVAAGRDELIPLAEVMAEFGLTPDDGEGVDGAVEAV